MGCQGHSYDKATCDAVGCCRWNMLLGCRAMDADAQCYSDNPCDTTVAPGPSPPGPGKKVIGGLIAGGAIAGVIGAAVMMPMAAPTMVETVQMVPTATPTMVETAVPMMQTAAPAAFSTMPAMQMGAPAVSAMPVMGSAMAAQAFPATSMPGMGGFGTQAF